MRMLAALALAAPVAVQAQPPHRTVVVKETRHGYHRTRVCRTQWRHHRRVRVCRYR